MELTKEQVKKILPRLTYREREILKLRYGINDGYCYSKEEVGHIFKVTRERIRQIEKSAVEKLKKYYTIMASMRVYVETSVVGGKFDIEFERQTNPFWDAVTSGKIQVILSDLLEAELEGSPAHVREFYRQLPESQIERIDSTDESDGLAMQYIAKGVVGKSSLADCKHIALATLARADVLVSWNYKHVVNVSRIIGYNDVNEKLGYPRIEIRTPNEVIYAET